MERIEITGKYAWTVYDASKKDGDSTNKMVYRIVKYRTEEADKLPPEVRESGDNEFVAFGMNIPTTPELNYSFIGYFVYKSKKKEWEFKILSYGIKDIRNIATIKAFLTETDIVGLNCTLAFQCIDKFGCEFFDVVANNPDKLDTVNGMTEAAKKSILQKYHQFFDLHLLYQFLMTENVSVEKAEKLIENYGHTIVKEIRNNPFAAYGAKGLDYEVCDSLAKKHNIDVNIATRISCAMHNCLRRCYKEGNLYLPETELLEKTMRLLGEDHSVSEKTVLSVLQQLISLGKFRKHGDAVYYPIADEAEERLAQKIVAINRYFEANTHISDDALEEAVMHAIGTLAFTPAEKQVDAVVKCMQSGVSVITGGPGTGKSTVLDLVIKTYSEIFPKASIALLAPSGKAARRMAECTKKEAHTVHKYLGVVGDVDQENPFVDYETMFHADMVVIDESSMLDIFACSALFSVLDDSTKVIFVGDVNQLPSVGPGNVLRSVIESGEIATTELNIIHRQGATSPIVSNSHKIKNGSWRDLEWGEDFRFVAADTADECRKKCESLYLAEAQRVGIDHVAALTPYRSDTKQYSCSVMAPELQNKVNPKVEGTPSIYVMGREFRPNDRVMQMRNKDDLNNGDTGIVKTVVPRGSNKTDPSAEYMIVDFNGVEKKLEGEDLEYIESSLCYTIHKSQGSEAKSVIIPLFDNKPEANTFINRNLIYTAVTRAKERVTIVGNSGMLAYGIGRNAVAPRNTLLGKRIKKLYEEERQWKRTV